MSRRNKFIINNNTARAQEEICEFLYNESIQSVCKYADAVKMPYTRCEPCETSTPTIVRIETDTCAMCGSNKEIQDKYMSC